MEQFSVLTETQPDCFAGPLWVLVRLGQHIRKGHAPGFRPRLLFSWGEAIRQVDREMLIETFGSAPSDVYRTWEFGLMAAECPQHDGLHVNFDLVHIEILRDGREVGPGEAGEVVVTALANKTMPLIRYRLGDVASWKKGPCKCGWQGLLLEGVHGRLEQTIVLPSGNFVSARQIEERLDQFTNVVDYRAVQVAPRKVEILVVPGTLFHERTAQLIRTKCLELFQEQIGVEVRVVGEIPFLPGPRRQFVVCKVTRA